MKHLGDITKIRGYDVPPVNIITGGSPCQDLSVAGKRAGLAGERSGLFMEQIRIIKEMRENDIRNGRTDEHIRPRFMVWENVPGAFSSNKGDDFRAVLEETVKVVCPDAVIPQPPKGKWTPCGCIVGDGWSVAWRVHDAQFWGVPQRRKRICLLADWGGDSAGKILFELWRETDYTKANETVADTGDESRQQVQFVGESLSRNTQQVIEKGQGIAGDVEGGIGKTSTTFDVRISSDGTKNWRAHCYETDRCRALDTGGENPDSNHGGIAVVSPNGGIISPPLDSHYYLGCGNRGGVEREVVCVSQDAYDKYTVNGQSASIKASGGVYGGGSEALVIQ